MTQGPAITYRDAGVDIDAGDELVERIKPLVRRAQRREVLAGIGGFGALIELPAGFRQPVLVAGTDGVGTKLRLAIDTGRPASHGSAQHNRASSAMSARRHAAAGCDVEAGEDMLLPRTRNGAERRVQ